MRRFVTIVIMCAGCLLTASSQTFTHRLQQKAKGGEGTVTVTHDKAIDELVNGPSVPQASQTTQRKDEKPAKENKDDKAAVPKSETNSHERLRDTTDVDTQIIDSRRKVMRGGMKVNGYRVQAFAGGNQRKDRQKAERIGSTIKANYPDEPIYVHFYSPRWICRVGNYRTYEEAHEMLMNIRRLGISGASIVKGKITVPY